jgi:hypothetical protein
MRRVRIIGQISMNSWPRLISERRRMSIRMANRTKIRRAACTFYGFFITSAIFSSRGFNLVAYLSFWPEYRIKQILSKLFTLFLFSIDSEVK